MSLNPIRDAVRHHYLVRSGDALYRPCLFPEAFNKSAAAFKPEGFWHLCWDKEKKTIETSLVWERLAPTLARVHAYGCRLAKQRSEEMLRTPRGFRETRKLYCGTYEFTVDAVRGLATSGKFQEIASADVRHKIEANGAIAHAELILTLKDIPQDAEGFKTAVQAELWSQSRGPFTHVCRQDLIIADHPSSRLQDAPGGKQQPQRPWFKRLCLIARYCLDCALWKALAILDHQAWSEG